MSLDIFLLYLDCTSLNHGCAWSNACFYVTGSWVDIHEFWSIYLRFMSSDFYHDFVLLHLGCTLSHGCAWSNDFVCFWFMGRYIFMSRGPYISDSWVQIPSTVTVYSKPFLCFTLLLWLCGCLIFLFLVLIGTLAFSISWTGFTTLLLEMHRFFFISF